jgi:hypothetical protein
MHSLLQAIDAILDQKIAFLTAFFLFFTVSFGLLSVFDFLPEPVTLEATTTLPAMSATAAAPLPAVVVTKPDVTPVAALLAAGGDALPQTITIDALDKTIKVLNPALDTIAALDAALLSGVVRHPGSATMAQEGNLFILGHSSYLPVVNNRAFQAFNGIQNLKWGDTIRLASNDIEYTYRVEKVYKAKASALTIPVAGTGKRLTLATCNSFGSIDDRHIVEASLVSERVL